jgi:hypothetical protein
VTTKTTPAVSGEVIEADEAPKSLQVVSHDVSGLDNTKALKAIAKKVKAEFGKGIDAQFAIGHLLVEARALFPQDVAFGKWFGEQEFPFALRTGHRLREAAEREPEVREWLAGQSAQTDRSVSGALQAINVERDAEGRIPKDVQKRVQALFEDEPQPMSPYPAFQTALANLNLQVLTVEELASLAVDIKSLIEAYQSEKARRTA